MNDLNSLKNPSDMAYGMQLKLLEDMMKEVFVLFGVFSLIGCAASGPSKYDIVDRSASDDATKAQQLSEEQLVAESCDNKTIKTNFANIELAAANCGLLFDSQLKSGELQKEICPALNLKGKECFSKVVETYYARLGQRYPRANWAQLDAECKADPVGCRDIRLTETKVLASHNAKMIELFVAAIQSIKKWKIDSHAQLEREDGAESARRSAAWMAAAQGMRQQQQQPYIIPANKPVSCTSNRNGSYTYTTCN